MASPSASGMSFEAALLQIMRQAATNVTSTPERDGSGSSHNSSVCSETGVFPNETHQSLASLVQVISSVANRPRTDRRGSVYSSVPEWEDPIPVAGEPDFDRYINHLQRHLPGFVYHERDELKCTVGKNRLGRSYFCRQIRKTTVDHGLTGERHVNIDKAVDQVLLYCPALGRDTAEREDIKRRIGNSLNCQRRHQKLKREGENYVKGPCKRRGEKKSPLAGPAEKDAAPRQRSVTKGGITWHTGDDVELVMSGVTVGHAMLVKLEAEDRVTKELLDSTAVVQVTCKTTEGESAEYGGEHVSWELHADLKWRQVEIGQMISWDYVDLQPKQAATNTASNSASKTASNSASNTSQGEADKENDPPEAQLDQWVAVAYVEGLFIGKVEKVYKKRNAKVKFLEFVEDGQGGGWYKWPAKDDIDFPKPRHILRVNVAVQEDKGQLFVPRHNQLRAKYDRHMAGLSFIEDE